MDWKKLLGSITESVDEELRLRNAYLVAENRLLRQQISGRVPLTDSDRKALAELGEQLGKKALQEIAAVATADTILAWHRKFVHQTVDTPAPHKAVGRPRIDQELESLVIRVARENRSWGYDRIVGALRNLGYTISDQTVGNILKRHGIPPAPERKKTLRWSEFIRMHLAVLGATDFFSSTVWGWYRLVISAIFFIHCGAHTQPLAGMKAVLYARWMVLILWYPSAARWIRVGISQGLAQLWQRGTPSQWCLLSPSVPQAPTARLSHDLGNVAFLGVVHHHLIRDGPRRSGLRFGGLRSAHEREAA